MPAGRLPKRVLAKQQGTIRIGHHGCRKQFADEWNRLVQRILDICGIQRRGKLRPILEVQKDLLHLCSPLCSKIKGLIGSRWQRIKDSSVLNPCAVAPSSLTRPDFAERYPHPGKKV